MPPSVDPRPHTRRRFLELAGCAVGLTATAGCASARRRPIPASTAIASDIDSHGHFDPWIEIDRAAYRNNVREAARLADGRPILAVVKNNAYGMGDRAVGPLLASFPDVGGIACVRVEEALVMREAGVTKPIVVMAEEPDDAIVEMVHHDVLPTVWLDDAPRRLERLSRRLGRPIPVQLFIDTGMNREGMPFGRARPWIEELCSSPSVEVNGTYTMFTHDLDFDREQLARFESLLEWARGKGLELGTLHASPTVELFHLPEAHYDMVRPGNALFGNYPRGEGVRERADLRPVFRLRTRVVRVERLEIGDSAGFYRTFAPELPTWIALLPIGRTDGYPSAANDTCKVLINGRLYPVKGGVNSAHAIIDIGDRKSVSVGDVATLVGPDHPSILPEEVARRAGMSTLAMMQGMNPRLPRHVV